MKVQNLAIIFLVVAIPLIMILSYYLDLQRDTLELQSVYDTKLSEATKEAIKSFEVNTVDWTNKKQNDRSTTVAMINTFITSLANNLNISGTARELMENYIPAIAATMYDGYYIYAPTYTPINKETDDGVQLFYNGTEVTTNPENGKILYEAEDGKGQTYTYKYTNEDDVTITETLPNLTTEVEDAKKDYLHMLNNKISYSTVYRKASLNAVVNYTLDNRIYVYGTQGSESINKDGYLVYFDTATVLPRININTAVSDDQIDESDINVIESIANTVYSRKAGSITNKTEIQTEILTEQILYADDITATHRLGTFKYLYDIENTKLYYDDAQDNFFTLKSDGTREFLQNSVDIYPGSSKADQCRYKSVSVLVGYGETTEYKKIYQVLNGRDRGKWYMNLKEDSEEAKQSESEEVDTEITGLNLAKLGLLDTGNFAAIYKDYSAINYYVESYAFTNWVKQNLGGQIENQRTIYDAETQQYENTVETLNGIFNISQTNDPEDAQSPIVQHKREVMIDNINMNLNLSISNYNRNGIYDFKLPVLSYSDWEQVFSNISLITFFQGVPIGLKYYNNYAIATSTTNREYVDPYEIYFSGNDPNYHRVYCEKCKNEIYTGYRSVEYSMREYTNDTETIYYYQHDNATPSDKNSETACYYCVVNKENYNAITDGMPEAAERTYKQAKAYNEALARERYYQYDRVTAKIIDNIIISVTKKKLEITNTDIIFVLDDSGSMSGDFTAVEDACCSILDTLVGEGLSENFYIGFIRFASNASQIGYMTNASELETMKSQIRSEYGESGGTNFSNAFREVINVLGSEIFVGRTNQRVIIFMTDGVSSYPSAEISQLQTNGNIDALYGISYGSGAALGQVVDAFKPNSQLLAANDSNITETFENILYQINASTPETVETVDGRLDISDIEISPEKPMEITVTRGGLNIKTIVITQRPVSDEGVIIFEGGKMYLSVTALAEECGLDDFQDVSVNVSYFSGT